MSLKPVCVEPAAVALEHDEFGTGERRLKARQPLLDPFSCASTTCPSASEVTA